MKSVRNLVPRVVSESLFQSSSQKTTLAQGAIFVGVFEIADISFECRTLCSSLLFRIFVFSMDCRTFLHMHRIISRDKECVKSNFESNLFQAKWKRSLRNSS